MNKETENQIVKECVVCGNDTNKLDYLNTGVLCKCNVCGMVYTNLDWEEEVLESNLDPWWYDSYHFSPERIQEAQDQIKILFKNNIVQGKLLDYGCGSGNFINIAKEKGFETYGIEIDSSVSNIVREKSNLNVHSYILKTIPYDNEYFDVITLWNVLEHTPKPDLVVKKMFSLLKSDGYLIIEVPNNSSVNKKIAIYTYLLGIKRFFNQLYINTSSMPGSHVNHFDTKTLKRLLENNHFKIVKVLQRTSPINLVSETFNRGCNIPIWIIKPLLIALDIFGKITKTQSRILFICQKTI